MILRIICFLIFTQVLPVKSDKILDIHRKFNDSVLIFPPTFELLHQVNMPRIGLGTAGLQGKTKFIVNEALQRGCRLIDTAQAEEWYSEKDVGLGIKEFIDSNPLNHSLELVLVTKVHPRSFSYNKMHKKISESLNLLLKVSGSNSPLDVVLLHSSYCWSGHCTREEESITWQEGWKNLEEIKSTGIILNIGISNFNIEQLKQLMMIADVKVSVIQNWMDPFHQDKEVRKFAKDNDITYMAYSSFGTQWEWKLKRNPVFTDAALKKIADKHHASISQVVLAWLVYEGVVAIPRASSLPHIQENLSLYKYKGDADGSEAEGICMFLDEEDVRVVRALDGQLGSLW